MKIPRKPIFHFIGGDYLFGKHVLHPQIAKKTLNNQIDSI